MKRDNFTINSNIRRAGAPVRGPLMQRKCACGNHLQGGSNCASCSSENKNSVPRHAINDPAPSGAHNPHALPAGIRSTLEQKYSEPLSSVRVNNDREAVRETRRLNANALSSGENISFARGRYQPGNAEGRKLIDHEVVHVLQQRRSESTVTREKAESEAATLSGRASGPATVRFGFKNGTRAPLLDEKSLKKAMYDELDDVFVGMDNVWPTIKSEKDSVRKEVFKDKPLRKTVRANADDMEVLKTYLLLKYGNEASYPAYFKAFMEATDFVGTHEARIFALLRGVNKTERKEMREMPGVAEVIDDEMSYGEFELAKKLLASDETQTGKHRTTARPSTHLEQDDRLNVAYEVMRDRSLSKLIAQVEGNTVPGLIDDASLWGTIANNFGVEEVWHLRMIARSGKRSSLRRLPKDKGDPYVKQIWKTVEGAGTMETELTNILTKVAKHPKEQQLLLDEPWFLPMLKDELSGDELDDAIAAIKPGKGKTPKVKKDLLNAIGSNSRKKIRKVLRNKKLAKADRELLRTDPDVIKKMGASLSGPLLAETGMLLIRRTRTTDEEKILKLFYAKPISVKKAVKFLKGLAQADQKRLLDTPGIYYMVLNSGLSIKSRYQILAAFQSNDPRFQTPGSEGSHKTSQQNVSKELPASFTSDEIRIPVRADLDYKEASSGFSMKSGILEDWTRAVDEHWNNHFQVVSGTQEFPLVFVPYMAKGISQSNIKIFPNDNKGRRSYVLGNTMHLFVGKDGDALENTTFAHEFGHILGNPDEYSLTPPEYSRFLKDTLTDTPDFSGTLKATPPRGGQDFVGMMAQHRSSTDVYTRHAAASLEIINLSRDKKIFKSPFVVTRTDQ
jgi:hypothetical protein